MRLFISMVIFIVVVLIFDSLLVGFISTIVVYMSLTLLKWVLVNRVKLKSFKKDSKLNERKLINASSEEKFKLRKYDKERRSAESIGHVEIKIPKTLK